MTWVKKGKIYTPLLDGSWKDNSALTPTAYNLDENTIRVFCGFRDKRGVSRIGFVDVDNKNPCEIKSISEHPILDIGEPGMFDDNGVILGDIIKVENEIRMYYVGFQLVNNVKFLAYSGLAVSLDNGKSFERYQKTPILDRAPEALYIRAIHTVIYDNGIYKCWYATGSGWREINGRKFPEYDINYCESSDGINFPNYGIKCIINNSDNNEYRIGRPKVYKTTEGYLMNYTFGTTDGRYQAGLAKSKDGINWKRHDNEFPLLPDGNDWDSQHLCYPHIISSKTNKFMFYNGNNMGIEGFGYAENKML